MESDRAVTVTLALVTVLIVVFRASMEGTISAALAAGDNGRALSGRGSMDAMVEILVRVSVEIACGTLI